MATHVAGKINFKQETILENIDPKLGATTQCSRAKIVPAHLDPCGDGQLTFFRGSPALTLELYKVAPSRRSCKTGLQWSSPAPGATLFSKLTSSFLPSFPCTFSLCQTLVTLNNFIWNHTFLPLPRQCPFQRPGLSVKVGAM